MAETELEMFLLTRAWRDDGGATRLTFWGASTEGPVRVTVARAEPVLFVPKDTPIASGRRERVALLNLRGVPVDAVKFQTRAASIAEADRLRHAGDQPCESDVKPSDRWLMERFVTGSMRVRGHVKRRPGFLAIDDPTSARAVDAGPARPLRVVALDVECLDPLGPLLSIAVAAKDEEQVFVVDDDHDEAGVLRAFVAWITRYDPDVLTGWSVVEFDLALIERRCERLRVPFTLGRAGERSRVLQGDVPLARVAGRVVVDGPQSLRSATFAFESFRLGDVAQKLLGRGKKIAKGVDPVAEIARMYRDDRAAFVAYNLEDCRLVLDVLDATDLLAFLIERQRLTGLPIDKVGGSVAAFDHLYLPRLHRAGYVAGDVGAGPEPDASPGGAVLDSAPGLYENVLVLDFRSLYPSIMRTWKIDPLGLHLPGEDRIQGFDGASFSREKSILPELLSALWEARARAREAAREAPARAIKILMNSFYGVLGTPGCRFFDPRLAASITRRGHEVIRRTQAWVEGRGRRVIYGDTDSLFVLLGPGDEAAAAREGRDTAEALNAWWRETVLAEHRLESHLEIRFDTHFLRFAMPTLRHTDKGTKKRYAGTVRTKDGATEVVIKGLEAVRTDWTALAREAQRELLRRVFAGEAWEAWLLGVRRDVLAGRLDDKLVYTKRLRRSLDDYAAAGGGAPSHVRAARLLREASPTASAREIAYVMTRRGPEPVDRRTAPLDYDHYVEKQLAAAADSILPLLGTSFERVAGRQLELF